MLLLMLATSNMGETASAMKAGRWRAAIKAGTRWDVYGM